MWSQMRQEAMDSATEEPLLVSFLHSTILNHKTLESAISFHMANKLASSAMISTQVQALFMEALETSADFRYSVRRDIRAVVERDPATQTNLEVLLYFKGFHALLAHRLAHCLWVSDRRVLASFLHSQANSKFQIDIHPGATLGDGLFIDHGTGLVIGETVRVGQNVSILHHVTLGGTGRKSGDRHPTIGDNVLIGAGASILGPIAVGESAIVGAGSMVQANVPDRTVVAGVPARFIGKCRDNPSANMQQELSTDRNGNARYNVDGMGI